MAEPCPPSRQPLLSRQTTCSPLGSTSHSQTAGRVEGRMCRRTPVPFPSAASRLHEPGQVPSLLWGLQSRRPHSGEDTRSLSGLLGPEVVTGTALHLTMVTHLICCPRNSRSLAASRKRSSRRHGALGGRRHMAARLEVAFLLGVSGPEHSGAPLCPRPHYPASWGPRTPRPSSLGVGLRPASTDHPSPHGSTSQTPVPARPGPLKGDGGRVFWLQESANGTLLITM